MHVCGVVKEFYFHLSSVHRLQKEKKKYRASERRISEMTPSILKFRNVISGCRYQEQISPKCIIPRTSRCNFQTKRRGTNRFANYQVLQRYETDLAPVSLCAAFQANVECSNTLAKHIVLTCAGTDVIMSSDGSDVTR